jgi:molybdopterin converting factor small subunit
MVTVHYYAGARAAAGVDSEPVPIPAAATSGWLRAHLAQARPGLAAVLPACSLLVDGVASRDQDTALATAERVDVLPPFAGG